MELVKASATIEAFRPREETLLTIERAGRTCYKSEEQMTEDSASKFVRSIMKRGHHSVIEHVNVSVRFIVDRGVTHELVRHRLASYSQESTRYCNYKGGVTFVIPPWVDIKPGEYINGKVPPHVINRMDDGEYAWFYAMMNSETSYLNLLKECWSPQQARSVLPNSLKTEIVMTANLREWLHVFNLRCSQAAHPQMREVMIPLRGAFRAWLPEVYGEPEE